MYTVCLKSAFTGAYILYFEVYDDDDDDIID
jgi:hypothetical protein